MTLRHFLLMLCMTYSKTKRKNTSEIRPWYFENQKKLQNLWAVCSCARVWVNIRVFQNTRLKANGKYICFLFPVARHTLNKKPNRTCMLCCVFVRWNINIHFCRFQKKILGRPNSIFAHGILKTNAHTYMYSQT